MKHWRVQVDIDGNMVLAIETASLCGVELTEEQCDVVRGCAEHLRSFVGEHPKSKVEQRADNTQSTAELERVRNGAAQIAANMENAFPDGHFSAEVPWLSIKEWARQIRAL
jgi:hypothetical protein